MKSFFRIIMCIAASALLLTGVVAYAESAGFAVESETAISAKTPIAKDYVQILWSTPEAETAGVPISDGEFVLIPTLNKVNKLTEKEGKLVASAEFDEKVSENCRGAVINGVLVQPTRTSLYAVNVEDMSVIGSAKFGEIVTDVAVIGGLAYFGAKTDGGYVFLCVNYADGFQTVWEYTSNVPPTSPALFGEYVLFGAGENLVAHDSDGEKFVENPVGAEITSVFAGKYAVFMSGADGRLYKLRLTEEGNTEEETLTSYMLGGTLTAPAELNNRVYVGSTEGFFIVDGLNMELVKAFPDMKNASAPFIVYGNVQRAYTAAPHADKDGDRWYLYTVLDNDKEQTASELAKIIDYTSGRSDVSLSGTMFFRDANGQVWAVAERENDLFTIILKIVIMIAIVVMLMLILRAWSKKRSENKPPQY